MHTVYNLEFKVLDKLGRLKKSVHVGVFDDLNKLDKVKGQIAASNPGVTFEVYPCEHIIFESPPEFV